MRYTDPSPYIPPGFDLEKYQRAKDLNIRGWMINLMARTNVKSKSEVEGLIKTGVEINEFLVGACEPFGIGPKALAQVSFGEILAARNDILNGYMGEKAQKLAQISEKGGEPSRNADDWLINEPYQATDEFSNRRWLDINLNCSDNDLVTAFKKWLKESRQPEAKPRGYIEIVNLMKYIKSKQGDKTLPFVLPFIDLDNWNKFAGNRGYSLSIAAEILKIDTENPDQKIKDIKVRAQQLTEKEMIDRMMSLSELR